MYYIDAINLLKLCVEHGVLRTNETKDIIFVLRETGWDRVQTDVLARELMHDEEGQKTLIKALADKGIEFKPRYN